MDGLARRRRWPEALLSSGAIGWALALPAAALAAGWPDGGAALKAAAAVPYLVGAVVCHQQAARSFALWSHQLPVCARCTGIYVGAAIVALIAGFRRTEVLRHVLQRNVAQGFSPARTIAVAALPTAMTLAYEWTTGVTPSNLTRAIAGLPLGAAVAWAILSVVTDQVN